MQCMPVLRDGYVSQSKSQGEYSRRENTEPTAEIKPPKQKNLKTLWITIIASFVLMGGPLIILLDHSHLNIAHIPILYLFVFALWIALCVLTFIGWRMRWGEKSEDAEK